MKAIRVNGFGGPEVLRLEEVETPVPQPGEHLVRIHAAGVNPVETYVRSGKYAVLPALPYTPGADGAGEIVAAGPGAQEFRVGQRVYCSGSRTGTYAEFAACAEADVHALPESLSFKQGAALGIPFATAYRALFQRGTVRAGESVLVHGATGGVGLAVVQLACAAGCAVFGTGGSAEGLDLVRRNGAQPFDHSRSGYAEEILRATGGRGVDVVIEMRADINLQRDLQLLAKGGRVVIVGSRGRIEVDPRDVMVREADVRGVLLFKASPEDLAEAHDALAEGLATGRLLPVVRVALPLAEAGNAHHLVMARGAAGKIVLVA